MVGVDKGPKVLVVVAHPDDEILWAGGLILGHPTWRLTILALCRGDDPDRSPRFRRSLAALGASGMMGTMDDGPDQTPLDETDVAALVRSMLEETAYDLVLTHSPLGEYTRHRRHEETSRAVISLWEQNQIKTPALWLFAYEDGKRRYLSRAIETADRPYALSNDIWQQKRDMIERIYGFEPASWEYRTTPRREAFRCFSSPAEVRVWMNRLEERKALK